jgi:uncharacterized protein (TIGR02453 family)
MAFNGFSDDFFHFFDELKANNNRDWFLANKPRYEASVAGPCLDFIEAMGAPLADISPRMLAIPKKTGGSMFRIYRDVRFSKDKTPYKTHVGLQFRHVLGKDAHAPGFYVHLSSEEILIGGGLWKPPSPALANIRSRIDERGKEWARASMSSAFMTRFDGLREGDPLIRPPKGYDEHHPHIDALKKRSFFVMAKTERDQVMRADFVDYVAQVFEDAAPMMAFLCAAVEVPF